MKTLQKVCYLFAPSEVIFSSVSGESPTLLEFSHRFTLLFTLQTTGMNHV